MDIRISIILPVIIKVELNVMIIYIPMYRIYNNNDNNKIKINIHELIKSIDYLIKSISLHIIII